MYIPQEFLAIAALSTLVLLSGCTPKESISGKYLKDNPSGESEDLSGKSNSNNKSKQKAEKKLDPVQGETADKKDGAGTSDKKVKKPVTPPVEDTETPPVDEPEPPSSDPPAPPPPVNEPAKMPLAGNAAKGAKLLETCGMCHPGKVAGAPKLGALSIESLDSALVSYPKFHGDYAQSHFEGQNRADLEAGLKELK